jgi:hypothetical membrane protein
VLGFKHMHTSPVPAKATNTAHLLLGAIVWMLSIQYFITQFLVAKGWAQPYSILHNTISDLGNTVCGPYRGSFVCSPYHGWMNVSFVALGLSMSLGSLLLYRHYTTGRVSALGFGLLSLAGLGTVLVGVFPENTVSALHIIGAALPFLLGNLALVLLGYTLQLPKVLRYYTICSGVVALAALTLFFTHTYLGIGIGGMERITAYPQTVWLVVFGAYSLYCHRQRQTTR